ncbi:MAG: hypothetical protein EKK53_20175 [Burkholderiales bacterium]|nr:MAG: hypothetical protein EKK53_20175 [Burkholderiales bacterium]
MSRLPAASPRAPWRPTPSLIVGVGLLAPALTAGISTSVGPQVALFLAFAGWLWGAERKATWQALVFGAVAGVGLLAHTAVGEAMGTCQDLMFKSLASQILLVLVVAALCLLAVASRAQSARRDVARLVTLFVVAVIVEKLYLLATGAKDTIRPSGFFSEPSHFALTIAPLLIFLILDPEPRWRRHGIVAALVSLWLAASATLFLLLAVGLALMWLALHGRHLRFWKVVQVSVLSVVFAAVAYVSPFWGDFVDRVTSLGNQSTEANVSSVVYVMGWELAIENLQNSAGWGLGFNRMGCEPRPVTDGVEVLELLGLDDGNYNDGSFLASKALSEMGYFAAVLWCWAAWRAWRWRRLLHDPAPLASEQARLMLCVLICALVGLLLRGTGYFSGPVLLAAYAYFWLREAGRRRVLAEPLPTMQPPAQVAVASASRD